MFALKFTAYLRSLPRASLKVRMLAGLVLATYAIAIACTFWGLRPGFTTTWIVRGIFIALGVLNAPGPLMVLLIGRMTRNMAFMFNPSSYGKTFSETVSDTVKANEEERKRSREM
jgi:hypothetical protein